MSYLSDFLNNCMETPSMESPIKLNTNYTITIDKHFNCTQSSGKSFVRSDVTAIHGLWRVNPAPNAEYLVDGVALRLASMNGACVPYNKTIIIGPASHNKWYWGSQNTVNEHYPIQIYPTLNKDYYNYHSFKWENDRTIVRTSYTQDTDPDNPPTESYASDTGLVFLELQGGGGHGGGAKTGVLVNDASGSGGGGGGYLSLLLDLKILQNISVKITTEYIELKVQDTYTFKIHHGNPGTSDFEMFEGEVPGGSGGVVNLPGTVPAGLEILNIYYGKSGGNGYKNKNESQGDGSLADEFIDSDVRYFGDIIPSLQIKKNGQNTAHSAPEGDEYRGGAGGGSAMTFAREYYSTIFPTSDPEKNFHYFGRGGSGGVPGDSDGYVGGDPIVLIHY